MYTNELQEAAETLYVGNSAELKTLYIICNESGRYIFANNGTECWACMFDGECFSTIHAPEAMRWELQKLFSEKFHVLNTRLDSIPIEINSQNEIH